MIFKIFTRRYIYLLGSPLFHAIQSFYDYKAWNRRISASYKWQERKEAEEHNR